MSHEDQYRNGLKKACYLFKKLKELREKGGTIDNYRFVSFLVWLCLLDLIFSNQLNILFCAQATSWRVAGLSYFKGRQPLGSALCHVHSHPDGPGHPWAMRLLDWKSLGLQNHRNLCTSKNFCLISTDSKKTGFVFIWDIKTSIALKKCIVIPSIKIIIEVVL